VCQTVTDVTWVAVALRGAHELIRPLVFGTVTERAGNIDDRGAIATADGSVLEHVYLIAPQLRPSLLHGAMAEHQAPTGGWPAHCCLRLLCLAACPGVPVQSQSAMSDVTADHSDIRERPKIVLYAVGRVTAWFLPVAKSVEQVATGTPMKNPL
jgi:hypothetical protein